jgi:hypothetical protein
MFDGGPRPRNARSADARAPTECSGAVAIAGPDPGWPGVPEPSPPIGPEPPASPDVPEPDPKGPETPDEPIEPEPQVPPGTDPGT